MLPNPHRETDLHYDTIIIGSSLEAMATAYKYGITIFCDKRLKPLPFTYVPSDLDLSPLGVDNKPESFKSYQAIHKREECSNWSCGTC